MKRLKTDNLPEFIVDHVFRAIELTLGAILSMVNRLYMLLFSFINIFLAGFFKLLRANLKLLKFLSLPWSILILIFYKLYSKFNRDSNPLLVPGLHMIRAGVGGGKSLTSFVLAEYCLEHFGMASYFTSPVEKPQLSEDKKYWYVMHRVIDLNQYYKDGKKVMNYNFEKYPWMHKDERHLRFNPRLNKTKEYNDQFIPEHEDELLMRHDGAKAIYKYSQHMRLDTQELENLTFIHEVVTKKDIPIKKWINDDKFDFIPIKLKFKTYTINFDFDGSYSRNLYKNWSMKVPLDVLMRFETHAESKKYRHLKVDYK